MTILHWIGDTIREILALVPLSVVRILFIALPVVLLVWVLTLPARATTPDEKTARWTHNLKIWAVLALLLQITIYTLL